MDVKDRHVLAAALTARPDVPLTDNIDHFPREWIAERSEAFDFDRCHVLGILT